MGFSGSMGMAFYNMSEPLDQCGWGQVILTCLHQVRGYFCTILQTFRRQIKKNERIALRSLTVQVVRRFFCFSDLDHNSTGKVWL